MPFDAFEALGPYRYRRPDPGLERRMGLPTGWGGPTPEEIEDYNRRPVRPPSVVDEFRGTFLDPEDPIAAWQKFKDQTEKPAPTTSMRAIDSAVRHVFEPPEFVRQGAQDFADWITTPTVDQGILDATTRGFVGGAAQGAAELLNPFDIATSATSLSAIRNARRVARSLEALEAGGSAFQAGAGIERGRRAFVENRPEEYGQAAFETAMGAAGIAAGLSGGPGAPPPEPARRGNILHPEGWRPPETALSTARWRPRRPPDIDAEFWEPGPPGPPTGPPRGPAGLLPDYAEGDIIPEPPTPLLPPGDVGSRTLPPGRRFYTGPGGRTLDVSGGEDELEAFLNPQPRFYGGRRGIADVEDVAGRTRVMGPTADVEGPMDYFDPATGKLVPQTGRYGAIFDPANEAVVFPPEVAAERGIYPEPHAPPPIGRLHGLPLIGEDEPGAAAWRGTGAERPPALGRQPVVNRTEQQGFNELAEFVGEGAPAPRQQADVAGPLFAEGHPQPLEPPQRAQAPTADATGTVTPPAPGTVVEPPKKLGPGRGRIEPRGLDPRVLREVGRMVRELEEITYQPASFTYTPQEEGIDPFANRPNAQGNYIPATPGSPLTYLIGNLVEGPEGTGMMLSRADIARRLRRAIEAGRTDNVFDAAVKIAQAKLQGNVRIEGHDIPGSLADIIEGDWALPEGVAPESLSALLEPKEVTWQEVEAASERLPVEFVQAWARGEVPDAEMRQAIDAANAAELDAFFTGETPPPERGPKGPKERDLMPNELAALDELGALQERIYGEGGRPTTPSPDDLRMGRPITDYLPEGYLEDPEGAIARQAAAGLQEVTPEAVAPVEQLEVVDPLEQLLAENASAESAASLEALSRQEGMRQRGEQFGVFDRAGNFRPLIGPDAVDYVAKPGETFGIMDESGFRVLDDRGGRVPTDLESVLEGRLDEEIAPAEEPEVYDLGRMEDILDTGEAQPRLPGETGAVRDVEVPTPQEDAPFSLATESSERPFQQASLADVLRGEPEPPSPPDYPEARHGIEVPEKVTEIAESMRRVGWKGRPALVLRQGDRAVAWTATHRLEAAKQAGIPYEQVPKVEVDAAVLEQAGYNVDDLTKLGKKKRIEALRKAGLTEAAELLEAERQGSPVRVEAAEAGLPGEGIPDNLRDFIVKQLKYTPDQVAKMSPAEAAAIGRSKRVNPNWSPPAKADPEAELARLVGAVPELAEGYQRTVEGMPGRALQRAIAQRRQRVPAKDVYRGGLDIEANLPESQLGLPERTPPVGDVDVEQLLTEGAQPRPAIERPESALTMQERAARKLPPPAKPGKAVSQTAARAQQDVIKQRAKKMGALLNEPTPQNLDEYIRLLGEQAESQAKRETTGGTTTEGPKRHERSGEYLASGFAGIEKLYRENPAAFWALMRSSGGALMGALVDDEDPLRGAALGAVIAGVGPSAYSRLRTVLRTGKLKPPKASDKDLSWFRMISPSPERTVPDVFEQAQETFRELESLYADPTRAQSANIAAKQIYLGDLSREIRELAKEANEAGMKRRGWYLNALANAVGGVPTTGQRKVQEIGSRLLEATGFSARKPPEPLHDSLTSAIREGRDTLTAAQQNYARAKAEHSQNVRDRADRRTLERSRIAREAAKDRLDATIKTAGEKLREAANTIDAEVGRTSNPSLVNQAGRSRTMGRKISNYKSPKQVEAALTRLETELGTGPLRVRPDVVESTVSKVVYRTLIGWAVDTAAVNLSQPILTALWVKPTSILRGYQQARTTQGRALAKEIELRTLVDDDIGTTVDERPLREQGLRGAARTIVADPSRLLRKTDNYNRRVSYLAALDQKGVLDEALRTGRVPADADAFARTVVRKTQGHTGPLGNNPFTRGPIGGSVKPFTKYPGLFLENMVDALNDPDARGRAAVVALLGAVLAAKASGLDFEDVLVSGGRPFGIDLTRPGSLRPERLARATPIGRGISDVVRHVSSLGGGERVDHPVIGTDLDSFLQSDLAYLLFGRYPTKVAQRAVEFSREGFDQHKGLRPTGEGDPHSGMEDVADLLGLRSTRVTEQRQRAAEAGAAVAQSRRRREDIGAEARRRAVIALQQDDPEAFQEALREMSPGQRQAFTRNLGRTRIERLEQQLPRAERPAFREQFRSEDDLERFLEGQ